MNSTKRKTVWITGASQGLGKALASQFSQGNHQVYISARNELALQQLKDSSINGNIHVKPLDITRHKAVATLVDDIFMQGPLDIAILNAGTYLPAEAKDFNSAAVRDLFELNFMATVVCLEQLLLKMRKQGYGTIAVVASLAAYRGLPKSAAYGASKAALIHLLESLQTELMGSGVELKIINPGFIDTPLTQKNDFAMPDLVSAEWAATYIIKALSKPGFEIRFPFRFSLTMSLLRHLPYAWYFPLIRKITGA